VAAAVGYVVVIGTFMLQTAGVVAPLWMLAFTGILWGVAFAVVVLLPLWLLFRRDLPDRWLQLALPAVVLWAAISMALFATRNLSVLEVIGNMLTVLPAGIVSVAAFILILRGNS